MRVPRSIYAQPQTLGSASVSDAGFGVAPKQASPQIQNAERNVAFREVSDRETRSPARETHALPRAARLPRAIGITCYLLMAITISAAPKQASSAVSEIRSVIRMQEDAWNHGDIDRFMNGYAHSRHTVFVSEDTVTRGWETVRDRYREKYSDRAKMGFLTFSDLEVRPLSPDSAVALGRWELQRAKDRPHGRFTLIFRRLPEGWRIVHDHTSAARPQ
jgi:ketosteroid isomerase-like protein